MSITPCCCSAEKGWHVSFNGPLHPLSLNSSKSPDQLRVEQLAAEAANETLRLPDRILGLLNTELIVHLDCHAQTSADRSEGAIPGKRETCAEGTEGQRCPCCQFGSEKRPAELLHSSRIIDGDDRHRLIQLLLVGERREHVVIAQKTNGSLERQTNFLKSLAQLDILHRRKDTNRFRNFDGDYC